MIVISLNTLQFGAYCHKIFDFNIFKPLVCRKYQSTHIEQKDDEVNPDHKTYHGEAAYCNKYFWVGEICASRLFLYHALHHWKWRLVSRLKEELKRELRHRREVR